MLQQPVGEDPWSDLVEWTNEGIGKFQGGEHIYCDFSDEGCAPTSVPGAAGAELVLGEFAGLQNEDDPWCRFGFFTGSQVYDTANSRQLRLKTCKIDFGYARGLPLFRLVAWLDFDDPELHVVHECAYAIAETSFTT